MKHNASALYIQADRKGVNIMSRNDNINDILTEYIERIYGYSIKNTLSRDEADELSQEILLTVIKQFPTLSNKDRFEPWLWGVAGNVSKVFRRKQGKQRAVYSYNAHESLETMIENMLQYTDEYLFIDEELYENLRTKITQLSKIYRDIIVLHYYDNLTTRQIAEKLNIPEGTVTWRLSEGRKKLKEGGNRLNISTKSEQKLLKKCKYRKRKGKVVEIYGTMCYNSNGTLKTEYMRLRQEKNKKSENQAQSLWRVKYSRNEVKCLSNTHSEALADVYRFVAREFKPSERRTNCSSFGEAGRDEQGINL